TRCQIVAGQLITDDPTTLLNEIRDLIAALPDKIAAADQLLVRRVLDQVLARLSYVSQIDRSPELARAFLAFAAASSPPQAWRTELVREIDRFATVWIRHAAELPVRGHGDARLCEAVRFIEELATNPRLRLRDVARHAKLSPSYLVRLLKLRTGAGFSGHLHRARVLEAQRRLTQTALTVKEIAIAVGYESSAQLDRHFKRQTGMTPLAYRRRT